MNIEYKRYAFISYNHHDVKQARWLHKRLESYKLPAEIHNEFEDSRYLRPVFRDQEDLDTGILGDELRKHLEESKYLVVVCSPHSARSEWVNNEVRTFIEWGRLEYIIPFIIEGTPNSGDERECFPLSLREYVAHHPDHELLGINTAEVGREKAFIRVISRMLGVSFDELWKRHERARRRRIATLVCSAAILLSAFYYFALPVSLTIRLKDDHHMLPLPDDAALVVNSAEYPLNRLDTMLSISNLPGYFKGRSLKVSFSAQWYKTIEEEVAMGWGTSVTIDRILQRDSTFAVFAGTIIDENRQIVRGATVTIDNQVETSDNEGHFHFFFPVKKQTETKRIQIKKDGYKDYIRSDESPDTNLTYMLRTE